MIEFKPCTGDHLRLITPQDDQVYDQIIHRDSFDEVSNNSFALSCWADGVCVGAGGLRPIWTGRAIAWALLGYNSGPALVAITKKLRFVLATWPGNRIEMTVRESFAPGCRLALVLGFEREARLLSFFPDGSTALLYARFNHLMRE